MKGAQAVIDDAWSDDAPAIGGPQTFHADVDAFSLSVLDGALRFELDRVRFERGDLWGTLTVRTSLLGARTFNGVLSTGSINLSSVDTRHRRAKQIAELLRAPQIDTLRLLESFSIRVHDAVRIGEPAVDLRDVTPADQGDSLTLHGIQILDRHPIILFGDGGSGKSILALWLAGELARRGLRVLFADWELTAEEHRARLDGLFGPDIPSLLYARCTRPLTSEVDRLRRISRDERVDYLICDSIAFACDGRPEDAEVATRYYQCLRQIGVGSLNIAHTNKTDDSDRKPFGSSFWHNGARATWNVKLTDGGHPGEITVGCFNRKSNLTARHQAVGFRIRFDPGRTTICRTDLAHVDEMAAELPLWQRIKSAIEHQPQSLASLAETLGAKLDSVEKAVSRKSRGKNPLFTRTPSGLIALVTRRSA